MVARKKRRKGGREHEERKAQRKAQIKRKRIVADGKEGTGW